MKVIDYICDKCSCRIDPDKHYAIRIDKLCADDGDVVDGAIEHPYSGVNEADYCEKCMKEIYELAVNEISSGKKKIDKGKVLALADAGWKIKNIADEIGVSIPTVYNIIKKRSEQSEKQYPKMDADGA